jgi:hypothetical protein
MPRFHSLLIAGLLVAPFSIPGRGQEFKPYAGSKLDEKASREAYAPAPGKQSEVFTADDSLDKVYAFYDAMRSGGPKLPSGQKVK